MCAAEGGARLCVERTKTGALTLYGDGLRPETTVSQALLEPTLPAGESHPQSVGEVGSDGRFPSEGGAGLALGKSKRAVWRFSSTSADGSPFSVVFTIERNDLDADIVSE